MPLHVPKWNPPKIAPFQRPDFPKIEHRKIEALPWQPIPFHWQQIDPNLPARIVQIQQHIPENRWTSLSPETKAAIQIARAALDVAFDLVQIGLGPGNPTAIALGIYQIVDDAAELLYYAYTTGASAESARGVVNLALNIASNFSGTAAVINLANDIEILISAIATHNTLRPNTQGA